MILCDTNILIEIYKGNLKIVEIIKQIGQHHLAISDVTCAELLYGARNKKELNIIKKDIKKLIIIPIDIAISSMAVELIEKHALSHKLSLPDALIAATSISKKIELFTLNQKDFKYLNKIKLFSIND